MRIRATSRLLAVIGDPVAHSLSPAMHNAAITALGLDAVFLALRSSATAFEALVRDLLATGGAACVTVPFKREAARLADHPTDPVRRTGACNVVWAQGGAIAGDNTDVAAVREEARRLLDRRTPSRALLLGTGGAARAVAVAISDAWPAVEVAAVSRSAERAAEFVSWAEEAGVRCRVAGVESGETADLVVNATPLGLKPDDPLPLPDHDLHRVAPACLLDLVYAPGETKLVREARRQGIVAADGRGVLLGQGVAAFRRFFGVEPPKEIMRAAVEDALRA
jgi:shikimate dehydrogenase